MRNDNDTYKSANVVLLADIDLGGTTWEPIGTDSDTKPSYTGTFDGRGHTVSNFEESVSVGYTGFFTYIGSDVSVRNLSIANATIKGPSDTGGIAGILSDGTIENCFIKDSSIICSGRGGAGGIAGSLASTGSIKDCSVIGDVDISSGRDAGGITGYTSMAEGTISGSTVSTTGEIHGAQTAGGLIGNASAGDTSEIELTDCIYKGLNGSKITCDSGTPYGVCGVNSSYNALENLVWYSPDENITAGIPGSDTTTKLSEETIKQTVTGLTFPEAFTVKEGGSDDIKLTPADGATVNGDLIGETGCFVTEASATLADGGSDFVEIAEEFTPAGALKVTGLKEGTATINVTAKLLPMDYTKLVNGEVAPAEGGAPTVYNFTTTVTVSNAASGGDSSSGSGSSGSTGGGGGGGCSAGFGALALLAGVPLLFRRKK